jgi:hypothetical protein
VIVHWAPLDKNQVQCVRPRPGSLHDNIEMVTCTGCKAYYKGRLEETPLPLVMPPNIITITFVEEREVSDSQTVLSHWENPSHVPNTGHFRGIDGVMYYVTRVIHLDPLSKRDAIYYPITCYLKKV